MLATREAGHPRKISSALHLRAVLGDVGRESHWEQGLQLRADDAVSLVIPMVAREGLAGLVAGRLTGAGTRRSESRGCQPVWRLRHERALILPPQTAIEHQRPDRFFDAS